MRDTLCRTWWLTCTFYYSYREDETNHSESTFSTYLLCRAHYVYPMYVGSILHLRQGQQKMCLWTFLQVIVLLFSERVRERLLVADPSVTTRCHWRTVRYTAILLCTLNPRSRIYANLYFRVGLALFQFI